jgi:cytidylate kinase
MNYRELSPSLIRALHRARAGATAPPPPFTVTVSREVGALGSSVAAAVGRRLGWPVYDREILDAIAEEMRRPAFSVEAVDERPGGWLEECLSGLLNEYHVSSDTYFKYLLGTVRGLGAVGRCVLVGRGANFILPAATTLRVRLVAFPEDRLRVLASRLGVTAQQAVTRAEAIERQRLGFVRRYFQRDAADPHHYDLVLNTSRLTADEAADVIVEALWRLEKRASRAEGRGEPLAEALAPASR